jgi:hypothetical protein
MYNVDKPHKILKVMQNFGNISVAIFRNGHSAWDALCDITP